MRIYEALIAIINDYIAFSQETQNKILTSLLNYLNDISQKEKLRFYFVHIFEENQEKKISSKKLLLYIAIIQKLSLTKKGIILLKTMIKSRKHLRFLWEK